MFYWEDIVLDTGNVYEPAEDSLLLADLLLQQDLENKTVLDMGTGSGLLAIVAAKKGALVTGVDIDENAVKISKKNAEINKVQMKVVKGDLFEKVQKKFDLILFNAPYLPEDCLDKYSKKKVDYSGGSTGRVIIERFIEHVKNYLVPKGKIFMVFSSFTGEKEVIKTLEKNGFHISSVKRKKIEWEELILMEMEVD